MSKQDKAGKQRKVAILVELDKPVGDAIDREALCEKRKRKQQAEYILSVWARNQAQDPC